MGKPKDLHAPPKPKNAYSTFAGACRARLKETRPELVADLSAMGKAIAEEWGKVPDEDKEKDQARYEAEMVIWRPKWAEYKETRNYKDFVEVKTDWMDKRAQKKLVKTMNTDAPKRPKSGYMLFAGTVREEIMAEVKEKGLGLGDAGRMIADRWAELSEGKKGEFGEQSQRDKIKFDQEFAVYRKTEAFGKFCDSKAQLEKTQLLKKNIRVSFDEAPKKAPSSYALFRSEVMPGIVKENEGKKEGEGKLTMGEMGKKVAEMWQAADEKKKAALAETASKGKEEYDKAFKSFKSSAKYTAFLEKRAKVKARENLLVNLREMPKRPKSVFAMFAAEHKDEVPKGKGEGKGTSALKVIFAKAPEEEKKKFQDVNDKLTEQWKEDVKDFKAGPKYQTFNATKSKIELEFKNEAIKVTTLKFLDEAPPAPAKTAFAVFVGEKRKAAGEPEGQKKSKEAKREEVVKAQEEWRKLDKAVQNSYDEKRQELLKAYEADVKAFMDGEKWQEYQKEAKRLRIPIKSLLYHKKKIIKKTKDGKTSPLSIALPEKPDMWPSKPQNAIQIFTSEKKKTVELVSTIHEMWRTMSPEDKAPFDEQAAKQAQKFAEEMKEFRSSDEGRKYFRDTAAAQQRRRVIAARNNFLDDLPKKPAAANVAWMKKNLHKVQKEHPAFKGFELKGKLTEMWNTLPAEEKEAAEKAATEKLQEFLSKMDEFKASDNWKKYQAATKVRAFGKAKGGGMPGVKVPDSMPKKPLRAMHAFMQDQSKAGKGLNLGDAAKAFNALSPEEKQRYAEEAREREKKYGEAMAEFEKSVEGRKYRFTSKAFAKRKRINDLKARFLKDEPVRPKTANGLWVAANRAKVQAENPDLKGLGPIQIKLAAIWKGLSAEERQEWTDKEKAEQEAYQQKVAEFQATDNYKKYKSLSAGLLGMAKGKAKGKSAPMIMMPPKPDNLPQAPKNAYFIFGEETRANGGPRGLKEVQQAWVALGPEGQKKYAEKAEAAKKQYDIDMRDFSSSADGKRYLRLKQVAERRQKLTLAKSKFLGAADAPKEPKRPPSPYFLFLGKMADTVPGSGKERATELTARWSKLSKEEKKEYEDQVKELKAEYDRKMVEYRNTPGYKAYAKTLNSVSGAQAQTMARAKAKAKVRLGGRGRGGGGGRGAGRAPAAGRGAKRVAVPAAKAAKAAADSDDDQMGSDSSSSSSSSKQSSNSD